MNTIHAESDRLRRKKGAAMVGRWWTVVLQTKADWLLNQHFAGRDSYVRALG